jgi:Mg/Co/Ni transporter MgtE
VGGFVTDGRGRYAGCVSFASLAEASQRGDKTVRSAFREDVAPITDDLSASAALPAVRNLLTGALPVIDVDGRLVGQVTRSAVVDLIGQDEDEADTDEADTDAAGRGLGGHQWQ